jgi:hypothetical protein
VPKHKVIPFPRPGSGPAPVTISYGWTIIIIESGSSTKSIAPQSPVSRPLAPAKPESLRVESRFLKLRRPAKLGERIDGWRVCWLGGWDKRKAFYKVQVDRVVRAGPTTTG